LFFLRASFDALFYLYPFAVQEHQKGAFININFDFLMINYLKINEIKIGLDIAVI